MNKIFPALLLVVPLCAAGPVLADEARVAAPTPAALGEDDDCDDVSSRCAPPSVAAEASTAGGALSASESSSAVVDQDCDGDACVSPTGSSDPSGMAINEKGLPGTNSPKKDSK